MSFKRWLCSTVNMFSFPKDFTEIFNLKYKFKIRNYWIMHYSVSIPVILPMTMYTLGIDWPLTKEYYYFISLPRKKYYKLRIRYLNVFHALLQNFVANFECVLLARSQWANTYSKSTIKTLPQCRWMLLSFWFMLWTGTKQTGTINITYVLTSTVCKLPNKIYIGVDLTDNFTADIRDLMHRQ